MYLEEGKDEVFEEENPELMMDNDEISPEEEAFLKGYEEDVTSGLEERKGDKAYEDVFGRKRTRKKKDIEELEEVEADEESFHG